MTTPHSEGTLIECPAIAIVGQLGWEAANCFDVVFSDNGGTITARQLFGRQQRKNAIAASEKRDGERSLSTRGRRVCPQYTPWRESGQMRYNKSVIGDASRAEHD